MLSTVDSLIASEFSICGMVFPRLRLLADEAALPSPFALEDILLPPEQVEVATTNILSYNKGKAGISHISINMFDNQVKPCFCSSNVRLC